MLHINELLEILPINCKSGRIEILTMKYLDWYVDNCRKDYYNQYTNFNFCSIPRKQLKDTIKNMINSYDNKVRDKCEARVILKNNNIIIGGCTIFEIDKENIELAYFVIPEQQHKGIAYDMLYNLIKSISISNISFKRFILTIQSCNKISIKLAEKLGFSQKKLDNNNITMELHRNEYK